MNEQLTLLTTESQNEHTMKIDTASAKEILNIMNKEDQKVALAVQKVLPDVEVAVEFVSESFQKEGRLIYVGAGTSGRLGVLDAVECPPTFSTNPDQVQGLMAGGEKAFVKAVEGAEDKEELGAADLQKIHLNERDTVIGIAASGRTPYVIGALKYAKSVKAKTVALSCNGNSLIGKEADHSIEVVVGPEVLTGSTRLKAASAHKMILNMISTAAMIKVGKTYENLMIDVHVSNEKLKERAIGIICKITGVSYEQASQTLEEANNEVKTAVVMIKINENYDTAKMLLNNADGYVRKAIEHYV
ncbi:N-acetylmuramic acid 6-phosphate etherase [Priestia megaterium]|jgi:N-acetylmuramic acid 6-phosphate etherase|uniref:N-acetylmuramic acid 6-phosphate etherase n=1 Tax=Priestia TaxID=2800373 RepID=UPI00094C7E76|nr:MULTISPECIES: N-acetylmuramic acid 6-phosphate etherase [Priestia]MBY0091353.1 N-acetylmuramic acid 6-phosphate etherase [Priestia aryabhattai]MBY0102392.1 N-acetylmuramic acid 6-phosphate etherase [Priestia aryabhattai]MCM3307195.1 N-acetylmuramic acid 6-phosphate etherase [Priestia megaterium]MED4139542.1 N-acetylmuramic acid 6-phosphate etherase [Priestia megaterium]OLO36739.1 N-acetylmuramic acid 6-phosphate etherase [Priestia megaterium]